MNRKEQNIAVFEDTMAWIQKNSHLQQAVAYTQQHTALYMPDETPALPERKYTGTTIDVTSQRSFEAAMDLLHKKPDKRICVLNFASATNPGGGVTRGSSAQEESLCRCSTLYPCLKTPALANGFYGFHRQRHDVRYTDACIFTPGIVILKSDTDVPARLPDDKWSQVDVISCAAPNLRQQPYNEMNPGIGNAVKVSDTELLELHKSRAEQIVSVAAANGADSLILGAFGCGAFQNDPYIVAHAYQEVLPVFKGYFENVRFAVYCTPRDQQNYLAFQSVILQNDN